MLSVNRFRVISLTLLCERCTSGQTDVFMFYHVRCVLESCSIQSFGDYFKAINPHDTINIVCSANVKKLQTDSRHIKIKLINIQ